MGCDIWVKSDVLDILSCIRAHRTSFLLHTTRGNKVPGVILEPNDLAMISLDCLLPACMRPGKALSVLCTASNIVLYIRVGIQLGVEFGCNRSTL